MINFMTEKSANGLIDLIDFEKVFDKMECSFLFKSLQYCNFGDNFSKWVKLLYHNIISSTINNKHPLTQISISICLECLDN